MPGFNTIHELRAALTNERYLMDEGLATVVFLALRLRKPPVSYTHLTLPTTPYV